MNTQPSANDIVQPNVTLAGNTIERFSYPCGDSALFESTYLRQLGSDMVKIFPSSPYLTYWVNEDSMTIISYAEGSVSRVICEDPIRFDMEMVMVKSFLGSEL